MSKTVKYAERAVNHCRAGRLGRFFEKLNSIRPNGFVYPRSGSDKAAASSLIKRKSLL